MENVECLCLRAKELCRNYLYREACRGTLTDDNAAMTDSDKHYV